MEKLIEIVKSWLTSAPKWVRAVVPLVLAALVALYLCTSCGVVQRVNLEKRMVRSTQDTTRLIISSVSRTTVRTFGVPSSATQTVAECSERFGAGLPLTSAASISAAADAANSAYHRQSDSARALLRSERTEIARTNCRYYPE